MTKQQNKATKTPNEILTEALERYRSGYDAEVSEKCVFPALIPASVNTGRQARYTGQLLGRPGPRFVKRGRMVRYRLSDVFAWLDEANIVTSTAEAMEASQ
ncbi:hypothetical protein [Halomonas cupida]|uniref:hypothetical protein n=1 Tax=Halomonas cupida TaxID=44933 RepID=UPI003A92A8A1